MAHQLGEATSAFEKMDRCADLDHRPRVLLGKMGLDGHDRGVKVIARALRDSGVHVIYSGLWQTPASLAISARDEDVDVIAASMMSNSHLVLGKRLIDSMNEVGRPDIPVLMGGILPQDDIVKLINMGVKECFPTGTGLIDIVNAVRASVHVQSQTVESGNLSAQLSRDISLMHNEKTVRSDATMKRPKRVIGFTGSPGAGKSTLVAQLAREHFVRAQKDPSLGRCAVLAFDPKSPITSGALLGDRLRVDFNNIGEHVYYHSLAIRGEDYHGLSGAIELIGGACSGNDAYDTLFVETVGAGQNETMIRDFVDTTAVVLTPGMGDSVQMDKAGILEIADIYVCNKADYPGEDQLVSDLRDIAGNTPIVETVATHAKGIPELFDTLMLK
jgi:methylmalonyl-CoA mutase cobalamin-binding domain/chain